MPKKKREENFSVKEVVILLVLTCVVNASIFFLINTNKEDDEKIFSENKNINQIIETYNYIKDNYYGEIKEEELINGAIKGMTDSLKDGYSTFIEEEDSDTYDIILEGEYIGVGIEISQSFNDNNIIISQVFKNSPAERSGLMVGDIIKKVNDMDVFGLTVTDIGNYIKNGSIKDFELVIERDGNQKNIKTSRGTIVIDSVLSKIYEESNKKIGYIYIETFAANTDEQFKEHLTELENKNIDSLIIDVRENSGGHLSTVTNIISEFLDGSKIIYQTSTKTDTTRVYSKGTVTKKYPIVVLGNSSSASASEVLIAALKESYGAKFVGIKTFGKGTVQELIDVQTTGSNFKLTTKKWLTPNGNWINETGIIPDYEVTLDDEYYKNPIEENDNQLQEALKLLK